MSEQMKTPNEIAKEILANAQVQFFKDFPGGSAFPDSLRPDIELALTTYAEERVSDLNNEISLLRCLAENMEPPIHTSEYCGTNNCDRCNFDYYASEYLKLNRALFWLKDYVRKLKAKQK